MISFYRLIFTLEINNTYKYISLWKYKSPSSVKTWQYWSRRFCPNNNSKTALFYTNQSIHELSLLDNDWYASMTASRLIFVDGIVSTQLSFVNGEKSIGSPAVIGR